MLSSPHGETVTQLTSRKRILHALAPVAGTLLLFAVVTLVALEGREVVRLQTATADGTVRRTRTWVAEEDGYLWIEAANEARPFLDDIRSNPTVALDRDGTVSTYRATVLSNPEGHRRIRRLLAEKYGWADVWVGLLTDTSGSLAVRLERRTGSASR